MTIKTNKGLFEVLRNVVDYDGVTPLTQAVCVADEDIVYTFARNTTDEEIINTINTMEY